MKDGAAEKSLMSSNPYVSPEDEGYVPPKATTSSSLFSWLAALGVLVLLAFLLLPNYRRGVPEASHRMQCSNHLKQIGLALQNYHDHYGSFPPAYIADSGGKPIHSWRVLILPFMEQRALYDRYRFDEAWNGPNNSKLHGETLHVYRCASRSGRQVKTETSYVAVIDPKTAWPGEKFTTLANFTDGEVNAILVTEMANSGIHWMEPRDLKMADIPMEVNPKGKPGISSEHPNVALAVFADGHTAAIQKNTPAEIVERLLTIADGQPIGDY